MIFMFGLSTCAHFADSQGWLTSFRLSLHDAVSPGRLAVLALSAPEQQPAEALHEHRSGATSADGDDVSALQQALLENELQRRQLLIQNARLHNELRRVHRLADANEISHRSLVQYSSVRATVISQNGLPAVLTEAIVDRGSRHGLRESELVVSGKGMIIDKGLEDHASEGHQVVAGTAVIGRINQTSRWVSHVQPITDPKFSAAVQIVKLSAPGASFGARGLLEGTGTQCRITGIPYTSAVAVGDEIFSADINGIQGPKFYFGRIVVAEFSSGGEWNILVEPAFQSEGFDTVEIVQPRLNIDSPSGTDLPRHGGPR